jgi:hypothetical protein
MSRIAFVGWADFETLTSHSKSNMDVKIAAIYFFPFIDDGMLDRVAFPSG